jgi:chemotaxis protein MotA
MNIGMLIGLVGGTTVLILGILVAGGSLILFWDVPSIMVTVGGGWCALMVAYPISALAKMPVYFRKALFPERFDVPELILTMVSLSEKSRKEGLLALEDDIADIDDPFMKKAIQLIVDGTDPELIRSIVENDIDQMASRHDSNKKIFDDFAGLAPSFGMIGTLMGLVLMLVNLDDKSMVGPYLAVAIITTFYGAVLAYLIFTPVSANLDSLTGDEVNYKSVILMGVLSIQAGDNPRILKEKLVSFLAPQDRVDLMHEKD